MESQSFYPASPHKELDKFTFTETHTHTDHIPSSFDHVHDEVTTEGIQANQRFGNQLGQPNQKSLTKVRSMPQTQFTQYRLQQARGSVGDETQQNFRKTDFNNAVQNTKLNNFSPVPNRGKAHELNQTMNTNVESRQFVGQGTTPIKTPKTIQKSTSGLLPQLQGYDSLQQEIRPATNVLSQESEVPVSNQRVSFQTNPVIPQIIRGQENVPRASSISIVNRPSVSSVGRPSFNVLQSNSVPLESINVPLDSRNVQKSLLTAAETRRQYQSILIDQQGNQVANTLTTQPLGQQKFSFISDTVQSPRLTTVQDYQQVQIQRPNYRKIYSEKGQYYRTVGPQQDYYKQEVTCCSKLLPALGVLALILLVAGTLVGIGALTGLIGGKNYLARAEGNSLNRVSGGEGSGMVINQVEDGKVLNVSDKTEVVAPPIVEPPIIAPPVVQPPIVNPPAVVNPPVVNNVTVVQPVAPSLPTINTQPVQTPSVVPVEPQVPVTPTQPQIKPVEPIIPVIQPMVPTVTQPTTLPVTEPTPQPTTQPTTQPVTESTIQPVIQPVVNPVVQPVVQPVIQPIAQPVAQPVTPSVQPKPVTTTQTKYIVQTETKITKPLPTIEPVVVVPAKVQVVAPASIQPVKVQPVAKPVETVQPTKIQPVKPAPTIQPSAINPIVTKPITEPVKPITQPTKSIQPAVIQPIITTPTITIAPTPQPTAPPVTQPIITPPPVTQPTVQPATPISPQQAQKVINIIIEENKQKIPLNVKTTIKQDILNEFETVPLNFRDAHQLQALTYKHIHKLQQTTLSQA